jgi:hypothetical protein
MPTMRAWVLEKGETVHDCKGILSLSIILVTMTPCWSIWTNTCLQDDSQILAKDFY